MFGNILEVYLHMDVLGDSCSPNLATSPDYDKPIHVSKDQLTVSMSVETGV